MTNPDEFERLTIIIPVYNQFDLAKRCVESVLRHTDSRHAIVIVDDASTDRRIVGWAHQLLVAEHRRVVLAIRGTNGGFGASVSSALNCVYGDDELSGDVVILNSDTEVPPGWVERLVAARDSRPDVATVSPLSNCATLYSVPNAGEQEQPAWCTTGQMDALVREYSERRRPEIPTVMGFCMLLTRRALDAVGRFDEAFGRGYGEEVDWCLRARAAGFACVLADDLYVWHKGHASFGDNPERDALRAAAAALVDERWPNYADEIQAWALRGDLWPLRVRLAKRLAGIVDVDTLYIAHRYESRGGVEEHMRREIRELRADGHVVAVMTPTFRGQAEGRTWVDVDGVLRVEVNPNASGAECTLGGYHVGLASEPIERLVGDAVVELSPGRVVIDHLCGWGTLRLPGAIARVSGAPIDLRLHDDFALCPAFRGAEGCDRRAVFAGPFSACESCLEDNLVTLRTRVTGALERTLATQWLNAWRLVALHDVGGRRVSATSRDLASRVGRAVGLPDAPDVFPHPVPRRRPRVPRLESDRLRVAFVGRACASKGWDAFADLARHYRDDTRVAFSVIGPIALEADRVDLGHVRFLGEYAPEDLPDLLRSVDVAVPAVARNEAWGMVVDECAVYAPALAIPGLPVMAERIMPAGTTVLGYAWGDSDGLITEMAGYLEAVGS